MALSTGYKRIRTAVFISGRGSNLKSLLKFSKTLKSPISIELIVSDNSKAKGLKLGKIFNIEGIEFVNLQYTNEKNEIVDIESSLKREIFIDHRVDCFNDIDGVASLINTCDFIISVSNTNVHIAGKLGKKVLLLLPYSDGKLWYWGLNDDKEIIWYPSIHPIRKKKENDWDSCLLSLEKEIEKFL